jgi:hypothetical protein
MVEETISTLKFADRARNIMTRVKRNEVNAQEDAVVIKLQREIKFLKEVLQMRQKGGGNDLSNKIVRLQEENERLKGMVLDRPKLEDVI